MVQKVYRCEWSDDDYIQGSNKLRMKAIQNDSSFITMPQMRPMVYLGLMVHGHKSRLSRNNE